MTEKIQHVTRVHDDAESLAKHLERALRDIGRATEEKGMLADLSTARVRTSSAPAESIDVVLAFKCEPLTREVRRAPQTFRDIEDNGIRREERRSTPWRPIEHG